MVSFITRGESISFIEFIISGEITRRSLFFPSIGARSSILYFEFYSSSIAAIGIYGNIYILTGSWRGLASSDVEFIVVIATSSSYIAGRSSIPT
jgi:hypothetical protein